MGCEGERGAGPGVSDGGGEVSAVDVGRGGGGDWSNSFALSNVLFSGQLLALWPVMVLTPSLMLFTCSFCSIFFLYLSFASRCAVYVIRHTLL